MLQRQLLIKTTKIESFLSSQESFKLTTSLSPDFARLTSNHTGIYLYNGLGWPCLPALCPIALAQALGLVLPVWPATFFFFLGCWAWLRQKAWLWAVMGSLELQRESMGSMMGDFQVPCQSGTLTEEEKPCASVAICKWACPVQGLRAAGRGMDSAGQHT